MSLRVEQLEDSTQRPKANIGTQSNPAPPMIWNKAKIYTSWPRQQFRVIVNVETDVSDKVFPWGSDFKKAFTNALKHIEAARKAKKTAKK